MSGLLHWLLESWSISPPLSISSACPLLRVLPQRPRRFSGGTHTGAPGQEAPRSWVWAGVGKRTSRGPDASWGREGAGSPGAHLRPHSPMPLEKRGRPHRGKRTACHTQPVSGGARIPTEAVVLSVGYVVYSRFSIQEYRGCDVMNTVFWCQ